jgi:peptidoglycan hydrolase-like protein with peptidoglycan-binding domain
VTGRRRVRVVAGAAAVTGLVVAAAGAAYGFGFGGDGAAPTGSRLPPATATVTRTSLTETRNVSGTLGFGDQVAVLARAGQGTVTWLAPVGSTVARGQPMYKVDDRPVVLLYGATPPYRVLRSGLTGTDVRQLESNLAVLGYPGFTVDDEYTGATADAVRAWQEDLGVDATGTVDPGRVVLAPDAVRVAGHRAVPGAPTGGEVLGYTGTTRAVTVALDVADQHLVRAGIAATVTLPTGQAVPATVQSVGSVATKTTTGSGANQTSTTTIEVVVAVADQNALGALDEAPVDVTLVAGRRDNVLTVPVGALVALREGGYGVLVVSGSQTRYVPVTTGMFAGGRVEVSGAGIAEGMTVGVPQ